MRFEEIVGQDDVKRKIIRAVNSSRLGHAILLNGANGYGSLGIGLALSQYILCDSKNETDSCGKCPSCIKVQKLAHPDLHFSFPVANNDSSKTKSGDDFLEQWRELLSENVYFDLKRWEEQIGIEKKQSAIKVDDSKNILKKLSLKSFEANYKILIMWCADRMNIDASNRLLKLIEEPPEKTLIILISEFEENILATIRSRAQVIKVPPISTDPLREYLKKTEGIEEATALQISLQSDGDIIKARNLIHRQEEDELFFRLFTEWMRACYEANVERIYKWVEDMSSNSYGREKQKRFLQYALNMMREGILRNYSGKDLQSFFGPEDDFMQKFSPFIIAENIIEINELLNEAHYHIERNAYAKIIFMDMSMQFANLLRAKKRKFVH